MNGDIFATDKELETVVNKVAELFNYPAFQFYISVKGNEKLRNAILKHDISFYEDAISRIRDISDEGTKVFERAKLKWKVFDDESGISSEDLQRMQESMDDRYYR